MNSGQNILYVTNINHIFRIISIVPVSVSIRDVLSHTDPVWIEDRDIYFRKYFLK